MRCEDCGHEMRLLFQFWACDRCDGVDCVEEEPTDSGGPWQLMFSYGLSSYECSNVNVYVFPTVGDLKNYTKSLVLYAVACKVSTRVSGNTYLATAYRKLQTFDRDKSINSMKFLLRTVERMNEVG